MPQTEAPKKIAVVCAHLPGRNTGMVTVDLSAHTVLRQLLPNADVTLYSFGKDEKSAYASGEIPFAYKDLVQNGAAFLSSDAYVYWGDFIHSRSYWTYDMGTWDSSQKDLSENSTQQKQKTIAENRSTYIFLDRLSPDEKKKAIVFGSTIITNQASDDLDTSYNEGFRRFIGDIGAVYFRDALSAAKVSPLRHHQPTLACDCALLLKNSDLEQLPGFSLAPTRSGVGVFLGRSSAKLRMLIFAKQTARALGVTASWIPWFPSGKPLQRAAALFGLTIPATPPEPGKLLSQLSSYQFIITDTYHLCVNAWRMGIPAICIGEGANGAEHSLADKKKEIFYEMYGARPLYVFLENVRCLRTLFSEARRVAETAKNEALTSQISATIQAHRQMALDRLTTALKTALGDQ